MRDIWDAAKVAAKETVSTFGHLFRLLLFGMILVAVGAGLVAAAFFAIHRLGPSLPVKNVENYAVLVMILPMVAFGWFAILFSVALEEKRKKR